MAFYPVVLAWRTTPVEWLGIAALVVLTPYLIRHRVLGKATTRLLVIAIVFAVVYVAAMSVGAKKFDRYILPVFPVVALLAAVGLTAALDWARSRIPGFTGNVTTSVIAVVVLVQALMTLTVMPYRLDFYSPILGGAAAAEDVLQMGWGQGGREVVDYIQGEIEDGTPVVMQTSAVPSAFSYFLSDDPDILIRSFGLGTPAGWFETDYYVAGIQQTQRDLAPSYRILKRYEPVETIDIGGVPYFLIYTPRQLVLPQELRTASACSAVFGETLQLMQIVGREGVMDLYWLTLDGTPPERATVQVEFTAPDGSRRTSSAEWEPQSSGLMSRARVALPAGVDHTSLADYQLEISVLDGPEQNPLSFVTPWARVRGTAFATQSECYYAEPEG